jgi:hypothetical protein
MTGRHAFDRSPSLCHAEKWKGEVQRTALHGARCIASLLAPDRRQTAAPQQSSSHSATMQGKLLSTDECERALLRARWTSAAEARVSCVSRWF